MRTITKDEYLQGLRDAGAIEDEQGSATNATTSNNPAPAAGEAAAAAPAAPEDAAPEVAGDAGKPQPTAGTPQSASSPGEAGGTTPPAPAPGAGDGEPFPGFNLLDEATRVSLKERFAAADAALKAAKEREAIEQRLQQREREFHQLQTRLAPAQQALARLQSEHQAMQERLQKAEATRPKGGLTPQLKARLDAMRENYPEDAALFETAINEAEGARTRADELAERIEALNQQTFLNEQKQLLEAEHPGWRQTVRKPEFAQWLNSLDPRENQLMVQLRNSPKAEDASYVLTRFRADTTFNDPAFAVWLNALDPASRETVSSTRRTSPMQVIGWFERDMAQAAVLARTMPHTSAAVPPAAAPPASTPASAVPPTPTPAPDPDPARRQTAPSTTAGQPMSDRKREFIAAAEWLEQQRAARSAAR